MSVLGDAALVRRDVEDDIRSEIAEELGVPLVPASIGGGTTVGSLAAGNTHGVVVSGQSTADERDAVAEELSRPVRSLPDTLNAAGNLVLATDDAAAVHPDLSDEAVDAVAETLSVPVRRASIGGIETVGMAAVCTASGVLCHPRATEEDLTTIDEHFGIPADIGTINHGSPLVGSGLLATTGGYVVGERTTGPELGRIEDALDLIE